FVVVWVESRLQSFVLTTQVVGRLVDADGVPLGSPIDMGAADVAGGISADPSVVVDQAGHVTVAWSLFREVLMRRFDASGAELTAVDLPNGVGGSGPLIDFGPGTEPTLAVLPHGLAVARVQRDSAVAVARLDELGNRLGTEWVH